MSRPPLSQLYNSVYTSPENTNGGQGKRDEEAFEDPGMAEFDEEGVLVERAFAHGLVAFAGSEGEVEAEEDEDT